MDSIEQCIAERASHEQELQNGLKRLNERKLQIQECKTDQNAEDERVALANLIANLKLDIDENKMIQTQLKKENTSLT
uniref:Uncharacterized protein n=1 Tax=Tanacetum cinerariifolium TaxID=118510 RepID=A0A6L2MG60_TANCI|nr:hypothetical protein [Tanacetum cinerariifolium]